MNEKLDNLSQAEQAALMRKMLQIAKDAGNIAAEPADDTKWAEWVNNADAPTRMTHPHHYWYVKPEDEPATFFWDEEPVSRQEYAEGTGEGDVPN
jgi:hypothetical protein